MPRRFWLKLGEMVTFLQPDEAVRAVLTKIRMLRPPLQPSMRHFLFISSQENS
jgi:hypothetical protein